MVTNVFEAVRKATDPFGIDGMESAHCRPDAAEVLRRLGQQGWVLVPQSWLSAPRITFETDDPLPPRTGIEQYQAEDR